MSLLKILFFCAIIIILNSCQEVESENAGFTTLEAKNLTAISAESGGRITPDGTLPVLSRGISWSKEQNPTLADHFSIETAELGSYAIQMTGLHAGEKYYVRAFYINSKDTVYGDMVEFTTPDYIQFNPDKRYGTVTDIDGNVYKTITVGSQTWMAENLRTTRYQNGDPLMNVEDPHFWYPLGVQPGAYCFYNYDDSKSTIFGAYYNWFAASDSRNIAPPGWHVATEEDWQTLKEFVCEGNNIGDDCGYKLRETSTAHWHNPTLSGIATNETGFTALAAQEAFTGLSSSWTSGWYAHFWTNSGSADLAVYASLNDKLEIYEGSQPNFGKSIRCVKD